VPHRKLVGVCGLVVVVQLGPDSLGDRVHDEAVVIETLGGKLVELAHYDGHGPI